MQISQIITISIISAMILVFLIYRKNENARRQLPNIFTILGILGTFIGIFIGLFNFDTTNIQASVPKLLEGLKTAFLTSIAGMFGAFVLRLRSFSTQKGEDLKNASLAEQMVQYLKKINEEQVYSRETFQEKIKSIETAIVGEGDTTIISQLQRLRTTMSDKQDDLIKEFKEFTTTMAEQNSKALIEALNDVIREFNNNLMEQFGDNFKQLNFAVGKLVIWQDKYREQLISITEHFKDVVEGVNKVETSLENIAVRNEEFLETSSELKKVLDNANAIQFEINENLHIFSKLGMKIEDVIPVMNKHMLDASNQIIEQSKVLKESVNGSTKKVTETLELNSATLKAQADVIKKTVEQINTGIMKVTSNTAEGMSKIVEETGKQVKVSIKQLDGALQEELTRSLKSLGNSLASLSRKFVDDYTPLTERLAELIKIANKTRY